MSTHAKAAYREKQREEHRKKEKKGRSEKLSRVILRLDLLVSKMEAWLQIAEKVRDTNKPRVVLR